MQATKKQRKKRVEVQRAEVQGAVRVSPGGTLNPKFRIGIASLQAMGNHQKSDRRES